MRKPWKKAAKASAARRPVDINQFSGKRFDFVPPEGVALKLELAGLGSRLGAQIVDSMLLTLAAVLLSLSFIFIEAWSSHTLAAILTLLNLLAGVPYYAASELLMNGRTFGKKMLGIRVISRDGRGLTTQAIVVRNLMKQAEFSIPVAMIISAEGWSSVASGAWLCIVFIVLWRSKANQRFGDMAAGTVVVLQPRAVLLPDLANTIRRAALERFVFTNDQLDLYGAYELQVLEGLLQATKRLEKERRSDAGQMTNLIQVGSRIRAKIGYTERVDAVDEKDFLQTFYAAQRAYLEQKKLFGEERADKFHRAEKVEKDEVRS